MTINNKLKEMGIDYAQGFYIDKTSNVDNSVDITKQLTPQNSGRL